MYHEIMTNKCKFKYDIKNRYSKTISSTLRIHHHGVFLEKKY